MMEQELKVGFFLIDRSYNAEMDKSLHGISAPEKRFGASAIWNYENRVLSRKILHHVAVTAHQSACFTMKNVLVIAKRGERILFIMRVAHHGEGMRRYCDLWIMKGQYGLSQCIRRMGIGE